jgi:hypothetical protein
MGMPPHWRRSGEERKGVRNLLLIRIAGVIGIIARAPLGILAVALAVLTQAAIYGLFPDPFALNEEHRSILRGLVYLNASVLLVLGVLIIYRSEKKWRVTDGRGGLSRARHSHLYVGSHDLRPSLLFLIRVQLLRRVGLGITETNASPDTPGVLGRDLCAGEEMVPDTP